MSEPDYIDPVFAQYKAAREERIAANRRAGAAKRRDKTTALTARIEALEQALRDIAEFTATEPWRLTAREMQKIARAALAQTGEPG